MGHKMRQDGAKDAPRWSIRWVKMGLNMRQHEARWGIRCANMRQDGAYGAPRWGVRCAKVGQKMRKDGGNDASHDASRWSTRCTEMGHKKRRDVARWASTLFEQRLLEAVLFKQLRRPVTEDINATFPEELQPSHLSNLFCD